MVLRATVWSVVVQMVCVVRHTVIVVVALLIVVRQVLEQVQVPVQVQALEVIVELLDVQQDNAVLNTAIVVLLQNIVVVQALVLVEVMSLSIQEVVAVVEQDVQQVHAALHGFCGNTAAHCGGAVAGAGTGAGASYGNCGASGCGAGLCCSKHGYCGSTAAHCTWSRLMPRIQPASLEGEFRSQARYYNETKASYEYSTCGLSRALSLDEDDQKIYTAALNEAQFDPYTKDGIPSTNPICEKKAIAKGANGEIIVRFVDRCLGCKEGEIALTYDGFLAVAGELGDGHADIVWHFI
ncbi:hypothetical protein I4U23_019933 [Adineta vaga]|nr:hypothetical protein I4U23_019933 [Adineta vaga]